MKKQYRYVYGSGFRVYLILYHDGKIVEERKLWEGDELFNEIEKIKIEGYTYGYLSQDVERAKRRYEDMLENIIEVNNE